MGLFNKKEEVPKIPTAPTLPKLPGMKKEEKVKKSLPELPSFPVNSKNENFNQEMVKSAITDMPSPEENEVHVEVPEGTHITEELKGGPAIPSIPSERNSIPELPSVPSITEVPKKTLELASSTLKRSTSKELETIFVRIDKFQAAQKSFRQIQDKVKDIELVLRKIKDVKLQEEVELKGWTEDVEKIKSRLAEVDTDIFNQI